MLIVDDTLTFNHTGELHGDQGTQTIPYHERISNPKLWFNLI